MCKLPNNNNNNSRTFVSSSSSLGYSNSVTKTRDDEKARESEQIKPIVISEEDEEVDDEGRGHADDSVRDGCEEDDNQDLEAVVARNWSGTNPPAPLIRRQKRRQRQRANAKVGKALRRYVASQGRANTAYHQAMLDEAQRRLVAFLDYIFGPTNLPFDKHLRTNVLDPVFKSATVLSIISFDGIQHALAPLGSLDLDMQVAIVVDSLKWSERLRCGPVCYPDGSTVFCFRVKDAPPTVFNNRNATFAPYMLPICTNCYQIVDVRIGYCTLCCTGYY